MNPKWVLLAVLTGVMWGQAPMQFVVSGCPKDGTTVTGKDILYAIANSGCTVWTKAQWDDAMKRAVSQQDNPKAAESRTKEHAAPKGSSGQIPYTFERAPECGDGAKMLPFNPCAAADKANADYGPGMSGLVGCMPVSEGVGIHSESTVVTPTGSRAKAEPIDVPAVRERPLSKLYPEVLDKNQFYYYGDPRWTCKDPTRALLVSQNGKYAQCHKVKP